MIMLTFQQERLAQRGVFSTLFGCGLGVASGHGLGVVKEGNWEQEDGGDEEKQKVRGLWQAWEGAANEDVLASEQFLSVCIEQQITSFNYCLVHELLPPFLLISWTLNKVSSTYKRFKRKAWRAPKTRGFVGHLCWLRAEEWMGTAGKSRLRHRVYGSRQLRTRWHGKTSVSLPTLSPTPSDRNIRKMTTNPLCFLSICTHVG